MALGVSGLGVHRGTVGARGQPIDRVEHVAGGTALAAVVAVEAHAPAHRAAARVEVALHALLAREVGVVRGELVEGCVRARPGQLQELGLRVARAHGEDRVGRAAVRAQPDLVEAVREVARGRAVQAQLQVLDELGMALAADDLRHAQVHRVLEAAPGEVLVESRHPLVGPGAARCGDVRALERVPAGVAAVAVGAGEPRLGVHLLDARVTGDAAVRRARLLRRLGQAEERQRGGDRGHHANKPGRRLPCASRGFAPNKSQIVGVTSTTPTSSLTIDFFLKSGPQQVQVT